MLVHCITLRRNVERQRAFAENWQGHKIKWHYGIDYLALPSIPYPRIWAITCCLLAHIEVWRQFAGQPGYHLICEDDAIPTDKFREGAEMAKASGQQVIKLHHRQPDKGPLRVKELASWVSTACYLVRNTETLLDRLVFVGSPDRLLPYITPVYGVLPAVVTDGAPTTIPTWERKIGLL